MARPQLGDSGATRTISRRYLRPRLALARSVLRHRALQSVPDTRYAALGRHARPAAPGRLSSWRRLAARELPLPATAGARIVAGSGRHRQLVTDTLSGAGELNQDGEK